MTGLGPLRYSPRRTRPVGRAAFRYAVAALVTLAAVFAGQWSAVHFRDRSLELFGVLMIPSLLCAGTSAALAARPLVRRRPSSPYLTACACVLAAWALLLVLWFGTLASSGR
jgi:hypothetical protein